MVLGSGDGIYVLVFGKWIFSGEKSSSSSWKICKAVAAAQAAEYLTLTESEKAYDGLVWKYEPFVHKAILSSILYNLQLRFFFGVS